MTVAAVPLSAPRKGRVARRALPYLLSLPALLVCIGILILRKRDPNRFRAFRTPWVPAVPILGVISCGYLMMGLPWITWIRFGLWLLLGLVIYFSYGYKRSGLRQSDAA